MPRVGMVLPGFANGSRLHLVVHQRSSGIIAGSQALQAEVNNRRGDGLTRAQEARPRRKEVTILATDQTLRCRECGREFLFTVGEQEFYASRGLMNTPSRCPECRSARKAMASSGSYGDRSQRQMYTATCSNCGREARVPFQPRGDKPVYCSDCYQQMGGSSRRGAGSGYSGGSRW
jgi:CxxC-x17-CxxC domain-containing protein